MKFLVDTHLLVWAGQAPEKLPKAAAPIFFRKGDHHLVFSAASIWEIAIKQALGRKDFDVDSGRFLTALRKRGFGELPVSGAHGAGVQRLPPIHKDPFDRLLVAQAMIENITLLTADATIARYPGPIRKI